MDNLARLPETRVDIRREQAILIEAESASMAALEKVSAATGAFVAFVREMQLSVTHPRVRELLAFVPAITAKAADIPHALSDCHKIAQGIVEQRGADAVVMTGGIPKEERPPQRNG